MTKTRSQTENIAIKKEEQEECKPTLLLNGVTNRRTSSRIAKRTPSITNNRPLPAQQVKVEDNTDTKALLQSRSSHSKRGPRPRISQELINQLIDNVVNLKMSVNKASRKLNIAYPTGLLYYNSYKNDPEKKIPVSWNQCINQPTVYTQEQVGNLIKYITQDKMTVKEASAKAKVELSLWQVLLQQILGRSKP